MSLRRTNGLSYRTDLALPSAHHVRFIQHLSKVTNKDPAKFTWVLETDKLMAKVILSYTSKFWAPLSKLKRQDYLHNRNDQN